MKDQKKILIVEDDPNVLKLSARILSQEGFYVIKAATGEEALKAIKAEPLDLIIVDLMLPDMNGAEILQEAREKYSCKVPAIFLTGMITKNEEAVHNINIKVKGQDYTAIAKPFDQAKFIKLVKEQLGKKSK